MEEYASMFPTFSGYLVVQPAASLHPNMRRIVIAGHQLVKADCSRLAPTNAVSHSQL